MKRNDWLRILGLALLLGLVVVAGACNDNIDDPDESSSLLRVTSVEPSTVCIDGNGELIDEDQDGTLEDPAERFFTDVNAQFTITSTPRNLNGNSAFNDVVIDSYSISYDNGAPNRGGGLTVTIPAGGSATVGARVVNASDVAGNFGVGSRGSMTIRFSGEDLAGKAAKATAKLSFESVDICK